MNQDGPSAVCSSCGATVHGPPGAMKCPYCGMRVDIPMGAAERAAAAEPSLPEETEEERRRAARHNQYQDVDDSPRATESSSSNTGAIVGGVVVLVMVAIVLSAVYGHKKKPLDRKAQAMKSTPTSAITTTGAPKPVVYDSVPITSCQCVFGDGQSTPQITLTPLASPTQDPSRPLSLSIKSHNGFVTSTSSATLALPSGTALTPLDGGDLPANMGVACDTGFYVLVVDHLATGWSSVNAKWKWNATLPGALADGADAAAPPQPKGTDFGGYCAQLPVQNGVAQISLTNGKHVSLSIKDGKVH